MTTLSVVEKTMVVSDLGKENPLPSFGTLGEVQNIPAGPGVPEDMKENMTYGMRQNPLPYTIQDGYSREKRKRRIKTIVLENDYLKAVFLPGYGGRLWSLYDKTEKRDIIYENPVIQPANLAIRNAWLSGGVEWNIGLRGHSPFTCSDVFAARVEGDSDTPILRIYEFERMRQVPFSLDFILPSDSRLLFVYVRIINPHDKTVPMYWWSNIAYPESPRTRVLAPADRAFRFGYGHKGLHLIDVPIFEGVDVSYTTNLSHSADFFFDIPTGERKWVAGVDPDGVGLFQTSVDALLGRKLFLWGSGSGGHAWQEFLSVPGKPYLEIQAGLAHTQMEHLPMPGGTEWSWLEAYGCLRADPHIVHGEDWQEAYAHVGQRIEAALPRPEMESLYKTAATTAQAEIAEILHQGSGWGFLETAYRKNAGDSPLCGLELAFTGTAEPSQAQWLELLREGIFPEPDPSNEPVGYEVEPKWKNLLEGYVRSVTTNWYAWLHLGLMYFYENNFEQAMDSFHKSLEVKPSPWAHRNIGMLARLEGNIEESIAQYRKAYSLTKYCIPLTIEYGNVILEADIASEWIDVYAGLDDTLRSAGRFHLLYARSVLALGRYNEALDVIKSKPEVTDLREGENSLTDVWYQIHEKKVIESGAIPDGDLRSYVQDKFPPPAEIDFRMRTKKTDEC